MPTRLAVLLLLLCSVLWQSLPAQPQAALAISSIEQANSIFAEANAAFEAGDAAKALEAYERLERSGFATARVLANAGTAAQRLGDTGRAVLYYRRALRADPGYSPALESLRVVSPKSNEAPASFLTTVFEAFFRSVPPWMLVALGQVTVLLLALTLYRVITAAGHDARGHWVAVSAYLGFGAIIAFGAAFASYQWRMGSGDVVVLAPDAITRSGPAETSKELMQLPPGTILDLIEEPRQGFVRVRAADGSTGFLPITAVERI